MTRRDLLTRLAGASCTWPRPAAAQSVLLTIGILDSGSAAQFGPAAAAFREALGEAGFIEGRNITIETRWAEGRYDRLHLLATELVHIPVAVLAATGITAALASQKATATIPVVFHTGGDPVKAGLVREPEPSGRQHHRRSFVGKDTAAKAARTAA